MLSHIQEFTRRYKLVRENIMSKGMIRGVLIGPIGQSDFDDVGET